MPTSFTGLLIFIAALAPGFAFLMVVERGPRSQVERSVLRETACIVLASVLSNAVAGALFAIARSLAPKYTPRPSELVKGGKTYVADHLGLVAMWSLVFFAVALTMAVVAAGILNRPRVMQSIRAWRITKWLVPEAGVTMDSAWWKLLKVELPTAYRRLTCTLDDGTVIEGWLLSFNPAASESSDRELALSAPLSITKPGAEPRTESYGSIVISAGRLQHFVVDYFGRPPDPAS